MTDSLELVLIEDLLNALFNVALKPPPVCVYKTKCMP